MRLKLLLPAALLLACCAGGAVAQTGDDDDAQSWSELELSLPLGKAVALSLFGELRLERNMRDVGNTRAGAAVSFPGQALHAQADLPLRPRLLAAR